MADSSHAASHDPMHQFAVEPLVEMQIGGLDISFTNASLFMVLSAVVAATLYLIGMRQKALVPGRGQSMAEVVYEFMAGLLNDTVGEEGKKYVPFVFSLFLFILFCNLLGMVPFYSFTVTSHIVVTFAFAAAIFVGVTVIGFTRHGLHFLSLFYPKGTPALLAPIMVIIEIFSYFTRPVSLSIRLAANMMAGHLMLKVIAGFVISMGLAGVFPLAFMIMLVGFEFFVAILQAYIFTVLTCVYLNDAVHLH